MPKVSPDQFKLFMTGTEWKASLTHSTDGPLDAKMEQSAAQARTPGTHHGAGVTRSMRKRGYVHNPDDPPTIVLEDSPNGKNVRRVQSEGHHRIAAAADIESSPPSKSNPHDGKPIYIPTNYVDNTAAGRRARQAPKP